MRNLTLSPPSERLYRAAFAIAFIGGGAVVGIGVQAIVTPEPKPIIRTIVTSAPPCLAEALDAARDERAHTETEQQHAGLADERAAELADAALTLDPEAIEAAATALDAEKRLVQQAGLDRAEAANRFDDAAAKCEVER